VQPWCGLVKRGGPPSASTRQGLELLVPRQNSRGRVLNCDRYVRHRCAPCDWRPTAVEIGPGLWWRARSQPTARPALSSEMCGPVRRPPRHTRLAIGDRLPPKPRRLTKSHPLPLGQGAPPAFRVRKRVHSGLVPRMTFIQPKCACSVSAAHESTRNSVRGRLEHAREESGYVEIAKPRYVTSSLPESGTGVTSSSGRRSHARLGRFKVLPPQPSKPLPTESPAPSPQLVSCRGRPEFGQGSLAGSSSGVWSS